MSLSFSLKPIGIIHSPYKTKSDAPYQGDETISKIEIFPEFSEGLKDIDGFSHLHIFYWLHKSESTNLLVKTPWDENLHGLFATRSSNRINPIGYAVVQLVKRENNILTIQYLDATDGTLVLDLKPYISKIDTKANVKNGWLENKAQFLQPRVYEFETSVRFIEEKKGVLNSADKPEVIIGCAPEFGGKKEYWSPQHLLIAAIEVCIMTTFFWLLEKSNLNIINYFSEACAKAQLKDNDFVFTEVIVKPAVTIDSEQKEDDILNLVNEAGNKCMVSKSINCPVILKPAIKIVNKENV